MTLEAIWQEYRVSLQRFLQSRVSNPADVDELLQEILLKSYRNLHTLEAQSSIKSWLFQIAHNAIVDFYRKKGRTQDKWVEGLELDEFLSEEESGDIKQELSECIAPFINALPEESAHLLTEIDLHNVQQKEYAEAHGISYSTLKSRVQKGRKQIRALFEDCCHFSLDKDGNIIDYQHKASKCGGCD